MKSPSGAARVAAVFLLLALLVFLSQPTPRSIALGALPVAVGLWWRVWAAGHLLKTKELAVSGPYRYVQNPLYFGRLCLLTGFCLMARRDEQLFGRTVPLHLVVLVLTWSLFFAYYLPRKKRVEGGRLTEVHGERYVSWAAAVPFIFPRLTPHGSNVRRWDRARFFDLHEEIMVAFVVVLFLAFAIKARWPDC